MKQRNWAILLYFSTIENQNKIKNSVLFFYKVNFKKKTTKKTTILYIMLSVYRISDYQYLPYKLGFPE